MTSAVTIPLPWGTKGKGINMGSPTVHEQTPKSRELSSPGPESLIDWFVGHSDRRGGAHFVD